MIIKDRLLSKYGGSLSFSNIEEELKNLHIIFAPVACNPTTHLPMMGLLYRNEQMDYPVIKIGSIYSSFKGFKGFDSQDILETLNQVENVLRESVKTNSYLAYDVKLILTKERLEQNKK